MLMKRDELSIAFGPDNNIYAIGGFGGGMQVPNNEPVETQQIDQVDQMPVQDQN